MKTKLPTAKSLSSLTQLPRVLRSFLKDETASGKLILLAAALSLVAVNSPLQNLYSDFWHTTLNVGFEGFRLSLDLRHWLNEALMAFFFLVVGLEIKREIRGGELSNIKVAALPIGAAIGGMIVPALIYLIFNMRAETIQGWGIPIATDIAFAVTVLTLLGRRVPLSLKLFLLSLAIADDIGAIFVIALFYAEIIHYGYLFVSLGILISIWIFRKKLGNHLLYFLAIGVIFWVTTHLSGIHASIVGAALGLLAPVSKQKVVGALAPRLERMFLPFSTFVVLPLFAFANAGFVLSRESLSSNYSVMAGIILGLVVGKALGIFGASWLLVKLNIAKLPAETSWRHILGVGFIAGIGFTVSIFITELAFAGNDKLISASKISIFIASAISAFLGILFLLSPKPVGKPSSK